MSERPVFVYAIGRQQGPVKIGVAFSPELRARELQTGCPFKLEVLHAVPAPGRVAALRHEETIHAVYADAGLHGEWFDINEVTAREAIETAFQIEEHFRNRGVQ